MALSIGTGFSTNDVAVKLTTTLNSTTSTTVKTASAEPDFVYLRFTNNSNRGIYLKLQAANIDDEKSWILIPRGLFWQMPDTRWYLGEISAIADAGNPDLTMVKY